MEEHLKANLGRLGVLKPLGSGFKTTKGFG
jgi:hypothetical protein